MNYWEDEEYLYSLDCKRLYGVDSVLPYHCTIRDLVNSLNFCIREGEAEIIEPGDAFEQKMITVFLNYCKENGHDIDYEFNNSNGSHKFILR